MSPHQINVVVFLVMFVPYTILFGKVLILHDDLLYKKIVYVILAMACASISSLITRLIFIGLWALIKIFYQYWIS